VSNRSKNTPGWPLLAVIAVLISVVALTVFKTPEIDNVVAWLFIGATLLLLGAWSAIAIDHSMWSLRSQRDSKENPDEVDS
jgi:uncharacterized membrane protein HdeD (DUF308 family)